MSSHPGPLDWKQVDEKLASLMMSKLSEEFGTLNRDDFHQIHYLNQGNQNAMTVPSQRFEMHLLRIGDASALRFPASASNANCALRTLRRMLHKAEEWKLIFRAPNSDL